MSVIKNNNESLTLVEPVTHRTWRMPIKLSRMIAAEVSQRWVANAVVHESVYRQLVPAPFLQPHRVQGKIILSLCAIFMKHAASSWAPLHLGPGSHNCALRIACSDTRDGSSSVWVDHRYSDSPFTDAAKWLGFAPIRPNLSVQRSKHLGRECMSLQSPDDALHILFEQNAVQTSSALFDDARAFADYFMAPVRSYGPTYRPGRYTVVDLHKQDVNPYAHLADYRAILSTPSGRWQCDSVYRSCNSFYQWEFIGCVDDRGRMFADESTKDCKAIAS